MLNTTISPIELVQQVAHGHALLKGGSLTDIAKQTRVEPIVLVDQRVLHLDYLSDVMHTLTSIFSAYYLQAIAFSDVNVNAVKTLKVLDGLSPNRDGYGLLANTAGNYVTGTGTESYDSVTTNPASYKLQLPVPNQPFGLENYGLENDDADEKGAVAGVSFTAKDIRDAGNLAAGKLISVKIGSGDQSFDIPITIRLLPSPTGSKTIVDILSVNSQDNNIGERIKLWRAGQIKLIPDLILCQDLIDQHRKALLNDTNGHYRELMARNRKNTAAAIATNRVSLNSAANIIVTCEQTVDEFELRTGTKLSNFKTRERMFAETYAMLLVIIEPDWQSVTIYHRGLEAAAVHSVKDMKSANRGNGSDIGDILKAYQLGNTPSI
jgi:hypothetical protein